MILSEPRRIPIGLGILAVLTRFGDGRRKAYPISFIHNSVLIVFIDRFRRRLALALPIARSGLGSTRIRPNLVAYGSEARSVLFDALLELGLVF